MEKVLKVILLLQILTSSIIVGYIYADTMVNETDLQVMNEDLTLLSHTQTRGSLELVDLPSPAALPTLTPTPEPTPVPTATPNPTPTSIPQAVENTLCINYGHHTNDYDLSVEVNNDLNRIKSSGINCLRLAYEHWNYRGMLDLAAYAKTKGFRVILGGYYGEVAENDFDQYRAQVLQQARWAEANQIDQLSLGNEQEYKISISKKQWYDFLIDLADEIRDEYSGVISYETSGTMFMEYWLDKPLGNIDMLGFNMYSGYSTNVNRLQKFIDVFGRDHIYVSETNADMETGKFDDDSVHAQYVKENTLQLLNLGIPVYYFTYTACNSSTENYWGLYQCGQLAQPETAKVLAIN